MNYSIEDIKQQHNVITYAQDHGINIRNEGDRSKSFIEPGHNKSCVVYYRDWWFDHKTRQGGDVIDLCAILEHGGDRGAAIRELGGEQNSWIEPTQNLCNEIELWHRNLKHRDYLHERGITDETIEELKIGENRNRIIIPYWKNGYVCNWIGRTLKEVTDSNPKYLKAKKEGIVQSIPWGLNTLGKSDTLVITEGAFDALSFYQEGYSVLAPMGGWFSKEQLKTVRSAIRSHKSVCLVFDSDEAGEKFTYSLSKHLFEHHITDFSICYIPKGYNDVSEYYQQSGEVEKILDKRMNSLYYLAIKCTSHAELKSFLYKAARFVGIEDMNLLIKKLIASQEFEEDWLKEIQKLIKKAPPQTLIADEVIKEHQLIFSEKTDFHEYDGNKWVQKTDTDIKAYIDHSLGNFTSNSMVSSVLGLVKARTNRNVEFNKAHLMNFKNGTLELDTGKFRDPKPNDYMTIQTDYNYNPNASFDAFQDFLIDVTDNVPEKINLLQEIFGYVMFPENTLHRCAYFIGEGSNGKSVMLDVLQNVYGLDSVSNVDVSSLNSEFQRIQLKDAMVNIAPDIKADMKQSEDYFKRIIAGDPINGCYKGRDFINFIPHAKFVVSANTFIRPNDTSFGMERRMLFVEFNVTFVDKVTRSDQRQADHNLTKKLLKELSGIFNWAYIGYKRLMENQKFTETEEQKELLKEFRSKVNPVYEFCQEYLEDKQEFTTDEAYYEFLRVTDKQSQLSKIGFSRSLSKVINREFPLWEPFRTARKRGYRINLDIVDG